MSHIIHQSRVSVSTDMNNENKFSVSTGLESEKQASVASDANNQSQVSGSQGVNNGNKVSVSGHWSRVPEHMWQHPSIQPLLAFLGPSEIRPHIEPTPPGTGSLLHSFFPGEIKPRGSLITWKDGFEVVCSYNWVNSAEPRIYVPGGPPAFKPQRMPYEIPNTFPKSLINQERICSRLLPFEPMFRAISLMNPTFRFDDIDIVLNRNTLRKLLRTIEGLDQEDFRIDLQLVNDTLFISRDVRQDASEAHPNFGRAFEHYFTKYCEELRHSKSYHRAIRYKLGPMDCVVLFEADAYIEQKAGFMIDTFSGVRSSDQLESPQGVELHVRALGKLVDSSLLAEMKAKFSGLSPPIDFGQLWFGRTPWLVVGWNWWGDFESVQLCNLVGSEQRFTMWEREHQGSLRKLSVLLKRLRNFVRWEKEEGRGNSFVAIYSPDRESLDIYDSISRRGVVPADIYGQFWTTAS